MLRMPRRVLLLGLMAATIGCDRVTKHAATTMLLGAPGRSFLGDMVRLEYAENPGGFLGDDKAVIIWAVNTVDPENTIPENPLESFDRDFDLLYDFAEGTPKRFIPGRPSTKDCRRHRRR